MRKLAFKFLNVFFKKNETTPNFTKIRREILRFSIFGNDFQVEKNVRDRQTISFEKGKLAFKISNNFVNFETFKQNHKNREGSLCSGEQIIT